MRRPGTSLAGIATVVRSRASTPAAGREVVPAGVAGAVVEHGVGRGGRSSRGRVHGISRAPASVPPNGRSVPREPQAVRRPGDLTSRMSPRTPRARTAGGRPALHRPRPRGAVGIDPSPDAQVAWDVAVACVTSDGAGRARTESDGGRPVLSQQRRVGFVVQYGQGPSAPDTTHPP